MALRVLFIYCVPDNGPQNKPFLSEAEIGFGFAYVIAAVKTQGHETHLHIVSNVESILALEDKILEFQPQVVAFTATSPDFLRVVSLAQYIRELNPSSYLILGGPQVSLNPSREENLAFDAICIGEGESALTELLNQLSQGVAPCGIGNLWIRDGDSWEKNPTRPLVQDLNALPEIDHNLWREWSRFPGLMGGILISRGCSYNCSYCSNHALRKLAPGRYVRFRSPDNILLEMDRMIRGNAELRYIYFESEMINQDPEFIQAFCESLRRYSAQNPHQVSFGVNLRIVPDPDWDQMLSDLYSAGFRMVNLGLESGSERVRREILGRQHTNEDFKKAISMARRQGFCISLYALIGIPGETLEELQSTETFLEELQPDLVNVSVFQAYPGTRLHQVSQIPDLQAFRMNRYNSEHDMLGLSKDEINRALGRINTRFGWGPKGRQYYQALGFSGSNLERLLC
jgi:anaerobic magnesium-protoporphyrin IX monomethyl ester cyclase